MSDFYENENENMTGNENSSANETRTNETLPNSETVHTTNDDMHTTASTDQTGTDYGTTRHTPVQNPYLSDVNPQKAPEHDTNVQNPYSNQTARDTYGQQPPYQNQGTQNPYGQQNPNGYGQYQQFQNHQNEISYTPVQKNSTRKTPKKTGGKKGFVAIAVIGGILLSTGFGFIGSAIGNQFFAPVKQSSSLENNVESTSNTENTPTIIYKSVDTVSTSATTDGGALTSTQVASMVKDSVVEINTEYTTVSLWYQYVSGGAGSGVIISEDGYIITNHHVICGSDDSTVAEKITVRLTDGSEYEATVVGTDSDADIAVLKIDASDLTAAIIGDSDTLSVGEEVIAVGNPLGELGGSVTNGIISALDRAINVNGVEMNLLQTNAAVNPGNSGGGLFNMRGELIGVVNAKSSGDGVEGLGFAIPSNDALSVAEQLMEYGYVKGKVIIGVTMMDITDISTARYLGLNSYGTYIIEVTEGYNDDVLQVGDRVISVDGNEISSADEVTALVKKASVGDTFSFQVSRQGKIIEVTVVCYEKVPESATNDMPLTRG